MSLIYLKPTDEILGALKLRPEDAQEIMTGHGVEHPFTGLKQAVEDSIQALAIMIEETHEIAAVFGVGRPAGRIWMVGSDFITRHPLIFVRTAKHILSSLFEEFDFLYNWIDSRNTLHMRWLESEGFNFDRTRSVTLNGVPFVYFYKYKEE